MENFVKKTHADMILRGMKRLRQQVQSIIELCIKVDYLLHSYN